MVSKVKSARCRSCNAEIARYFEDEDIIAPVRYGIHTNFHITLGGHREHWFKCTRCNGTTKTIIFNKNLTAESVVLNDE